MLMLYEKEGTTLLIRGFILHFGSYELTCT